MDGTVSTRGWLRGTILAPVLCWSVIVPSAASASCAETTEAEHRARADVVLEGRALPGPAVDGVLFTPARFEVDVYLEGDGPKVVEVVTASRDEGGGMVSHLSVGIDPRAGETWRIYATRPAAGGPLETSVCAGTIRLAAAPPTEVDLDGGVAAPNGDGATAGRRSTTSMALPLAFGLAILAVAGTALAARRPPHRRPA
jgi:hypothetical protein